MADQSSSLTSPLSDDELRETLDMVGTVLASVSNRVDAQTSAMDQLIKTATEARQAAFAARSQTDPKHYGDLVGKTIDGRINDNLVRMGQMVIDLFEASNRAQTALRKGEDDKLAILKQVRDREVKVEHLYNRLPWFGLGALVLALAMTVLLPHFLASNAATCAVLGAEWTRTTSGTDACVFYDR